MAWLLILAVFLQAFHKEWILSDYHDCASDYAASCMLHNNSEMTSCDVQCQLKCSLHKNPHQAPLPLMQLRLPEIVMFYQQPSDLLTPLFFDEKVPNPAFFQPFKTQQVSSAMLKPPII